jgi:hypothetical protein
MIYKTSLRDRIAARSKANSKKMNPNGVKLGDIIKARPEKLAKAKAALAAALNKKKEKNTDAL